MDHPKRINEAAAALCEAVEAGRVAGYRVDVDLGRLRSIPVSETAAVVAPSEPAPVPVIGRASKAADPA
jgi:hypothetical protein